jgi:hypothetical protein
MKRYLLLLLFLAAPAIADAPKDALSRLNRCIAANDSAACREEVTANSIALYDRFAQHRLMHCLPHDVEAVSQRNAGPFRVVRVSATVGQEKRYLRLWMAEEEGAWKLDIPASLTSGLGENWENTVNGTEALYVLMKRQLGDKLGCAVIQGMAEDQARKR